MTPDKGFQRCADAAIDDETRSFVKTMSPSEVIEEGKRREVGDLARSHETIP